jgi:hypothetical protein
MSAVFGFGLPVKSVRWLPDAHLAIRTESSISQPLANTSQISAVPVKQTVTLSRLSWKALTDIGKLGHVELKKPMAARLSELQRWSDDRGGRMSTADRCFAGISHAALDWKSRTHWWHLPSFLVASCQTIILMLCVFPLFMGLGVPQLLFDCSARYVCLIGRGRLKAIRETLGTGFSAKFPAKSLTDCFTRPRASRCLIRR